MYCPSTSIQLNGSSIPLFNSTTYYDKLTFAAAWMYRVSKPWWLHLHCCSWPARACCCSCWAAGCLSTTCCMHSAGKAGMSPCCSHHSHSSSCMELICMGTKQGAHGSPMWHSPWRTHTCSSMSTEHLSMEHTDAWVLPSGDGGSKLPERRQRLLHAAPVHGGLLHRHHVRLERLLLGQQRPAGHHDGAVQLPLPHAVLHAPVGLRLLSGAAPALAHCSALQEGQPAFLTASKARAASRQACSTHAHLPGFLAACSLMVTRHQYMQDRCPCNKLCLPAQPAGQPD